MTATTHIRVCPECGDRKAYQRSSRPKPGALCWPCYSARYLHRGRNEYQDYVDEVAVQRLVSGGLPVKATAAERRLAVAQLDRHHLTAGQIATRLGCTIRTVERARARNRKDKTA